MKIEKLDGRINNLETKFDERINNLEKNLMKELII